VVFNIASRMIVNRLKKILPEIVLEELPEFVPGRLIKYNVIMAYECWQLMKNNRRKKNSHYALKLYMQKAYDHLGWDYLEAIMKKLGFALRFVHTPS
jgi:hypothetical protein